jgi:hypothetical protein
MQAAVVKAIDPLISLSRGQQLSLGDEVVCSDFISTYVPREFTPALYSTKPESLQAKALDSSIN